MRIVPCIDRTVGLEIRHNTSSINLGRFPNLSGAELVEQQTVVILLDKILQLLVFCTKTFSLLVKNLFGCVLALILLRQRIQSIRCQTFVHATALHEAMNLRMQAIEWFQLLALEHLYDVIAYRTEERLAHLAWFETVCHFLELLQGVARTNPWQCTTVLAGLDVIAQCVGKILECSALQQRIVDAVCQQALLLLKLGIGILRHKHKNVCRTQQVLSAKGGKHFVVVVLTLLLDNHIRHKHGTNLQITVVAEFLLESRSGVHLCVQCCTHLHLIDGEQVSILAHALLVHYSIRIVLIEVIFKFTTGDRFSCNGHHNWVRSLLGRHEGCRKAQGTGCQYFLKHSFR